jgi:hypothetical protein
MSSTDSDTFPEVVSALFDEVLAPMAEAIRASGRQPFPLKPEATCQTYYLSREKRTMTRNDFIATSCSDFADLEIRLSAYWTALGRDDLAAEVPRFVAAARALHTHAEQDSEVSPFVYVMY